MDMRTTLELKGGWISSVSRAKTILLIQIHLFRHLAVKRNMRVWVGTETRWTLCSISLFYCSAVVRQNPLLVFLWWFLILNSLWAQVRAFLYLILTITSNNEQRIDISLHIGAFYYSVCIEQLRSKVSRKKRREVRQIMFIWQNRVCARQMFITITNVCDDSSWREKV